MAKRCAAALIDLMLNGLKTGSGATGPANKVTVCSAEPTTYTEANATYMLANVAMAGTDYTVQAGTGAGNSPRRVTMGAKNGVSVSTSGSATHLALIDTVNSILMEVTTVTTQSLTSGNTVNIPSWNIEVSAPT